MTLLVAFATLVLTVLLYIVIPKGFFPVQDTGEIQRDHGSGPEYLVPQNGGLAAADLQASFSKIPRLKPLFLHWS